MLPWSPRLGSDTEVRVKQLPVFSREVAVGSRRVDPARYTWNDRGVPKVTLQTGVIRIEKASTARQGKRYDVQVVGPKTAGLAEFVLVSTDSGTTNLSHAAAHTPCFQQPASEIAIVYEFFQDFPADNKLSTPIIQPVPKTHTGRCLLSSEHFERNARVDYGAHQ